MSGDVGDPTGAVLSVSSLLPNFSFTLLIHCWEGLLNLYIRIGRKTVSSGGGAGGGFALSVPTLNPDRSSDTLLLWSTIPQYFVASLIPISRYKSHLKSSSCSFEKEGPGAFHLTANSYNACSTKPPSRRIESFV